MSETYPSGGQLWLTPGGVILAAGSFLAALLVIAGLIYATGTGARHEAALTAADCELSLSPSGLPCTTAQMLTSQYLAILTPASQQMNAEMADYTASERRNLAAARLALTAEVVSEHAFDTNLANITFPPAIAPIARSLIQADQALATLTASQAQARSLTRLRSYNRRAQAASAAVQTQMNQIRKALTS
jgi:hypothetical protein